MKPVKLPAIASAIVVFAALLFAGCLGGNENNYVISPLPSIPAVPSFEIPSIPAISPIPTITIASPEATFYWPSPIPTTGVVGIGERSNSQRFEVVVTQVEYPAFIYIPGSGPGFRNEEYPHSGNKFLVLHFTLKNLMNEDWLLNSLDYGLLIDGELELFYPDHITAPGTHGGFGIMTDLHPQETTTAQLIYQIPVNASSAILVIGDDEYVRIS